MFCKKAKTGGYEMNNTTLTPNIPIELGKRIDDIIDLAAFHELPGIVYDQIGDIFHIDIGLNWESTGGSRQMATLIIPQGQSANLSIGDRLNVRVIQTNFQTKEVVVIIA
jgi:hypothetical protein